MSVWEKAKAWIIDIEGGESSDPNDLASKDAPGLVHTKYGITIGTLRRAFAQGLVSHCDIRKLTVPEAGVIYKVWYWNRVMGDHLPPKVAFVLFDAAVNQGPESAIGQLQFIVGTKTDGRMGPATVRAVNDYVARNGADRLVAELMLQRAYRYARLKTAKFHLRGWINRLSELSEALLGLEVA